MSIKMKNILKVVQLGRVLLFLVFIFGGVTDAGAQFIKASDIFPSEVKKQNAGRLNIYHEPQIDTLLSRYLLSNKLLGGGIEGYRIQIYRSAVRNAREEANKIKADFMISFPDIPSYVEYEKPGYFIVRVGDFRTKIEGTKALYMIRKKYPYAYMIPCIINIPD